MKTYEDFLLFLDDHLKSMTDFIPASDKDFHAICITTGRLLLSEPYRWEKLLDEWMTLPEVTVPGNDELLEFFTSKKGFKLSFRKELLAKDYETMGNAYKIIYPLLVIKHEFLSSIFRDDIKARRFKQIYKESGKKIIRVRNFITSRVKDDVKFLELMQKFTKDLEGFSLTLINNKNLLDQAIKKIEER
ncbi:MAG: hypothetical protein GY757_34545 [bacterium]|nr:hypothetical protein [bacterium]